MKKGRQSTFLFVVGLIIVFSLFVLVLSLQNKGVLAGKAHNIGELRQVLGNVAGNDDQITIQDATTIVQHVVGTASLSGDNLLLADVNCDRLINVRDVIYTVRKVLNPTISYSCPPILDTIGDKQAVVGQEMRFTITAADPEHGVYTLSAVNLPVGATFDSTTDQFEWIPTASQAGTYVVTFTVTDDEGLIDSEDVSIVALAAVGRVPLTDMLPTQGYLGQFSGGLYPGGLNYAPTAHDAEGRRLATEIQPLDANGNPSTTGKVVLISVGMSNTNQEFCSFPSAFTPGNNQCNSWSAVGQFTSNQYVNHDTFFPVNCARGGQEISFWLDPYQMVTQDGSFYYNNYNICDDRLTSLGLSRNQVQIAWVKLANALFQNTLPRISLPDNNADAYFFQTRLAQVVHALKARYPNLKQIFFSSRIYGGFQSPTTGISPEPFAYEYGYSVKWLIEAQIRQMENNGALDMNDANQVRIYNTPVLSNGSIPNSHISLNYNDASAPWLGWGPYIWADSTTARSVSLPWDPAGMIWLRTDIEADETHPADSGEAKVGLALLRFFLGSPYTAAYVSASGQQVTSDGQVIS